MKWYCSVLCCLGLAACGGDDARHIQSPVMAALASQEPPSASTLVYGCNDYEFVARLGEGEIALWLEEGYVILSRVPSASGTLYEEGEISFWSKGDDAMLTLGEQSYQNCHLLPERVPWEDARRRGVDFRAVGNEPGWYLEVQGGRQILFVSEYGMQRVIVPDQGVETEGPLRVHIAVTDTHELRVEIVEETCVDTMSGHTFPSRVAVTLDQATYHGCGQTLDYPWEDL